METDRKIQPAWRVQIQVPNPETVEQAENPIIKSTWMFFYNGQPAMDEKVLSEVRSSRSIYTFGYNGKKKKKKGKAANKVERIYFISYIIMYFVEKKLAFKMMISAMKFAKFLAKNRQQMKQNYQCHRKNRTPRNFTLQLKFYGFIKGRGATNPPPINKSNINSSHLQVNSFFPLHFFKSPQFYKNVSQWRQRSADLPLALQKYFSSNCRVRFKYILWGLSVKKWFSNIHSNGHSPFWHYSYSIDIIIQ